MVDAEWLKVFGEEEAHRTKVFLMALIGILLGYQMSVK